MFTGIVAGTGKLVEKKNAGGGMVFRLLADFDLSDPVEGESIAVNGSCLTAYAIDGRNFFVDVSPETIGRTTLGGLAIGAMVNMERALKLSDRLGGHIVSGHIDCTARVSDIRKTGEFTIFTFALAQRLGRYIIEKGSVAIDGVSLTVNQCMGEKFSVSVIPHTLQVTTLGGLRKGSSVNVEVDIIGKYVERMLAGRQVEKDGASGGIEPGFLAEHGFF